MEKARGNLTAIGDRIVQRLNARRAKQVAQGSRRKAEGLRMFSYILAPCAFAPCANCLFVFYSGF